MDNCEIMDRKKYNRFFFFSFLLINVTIKFLRLVSEKQCCLLNSCN